MHLATCLPPRLPTDSAEEPEIFDLHDAPWQERQIHIAVKMQSVASALFRYGHGSDLLGLYDLFR